MRKHKKMTLRARISRFWPSLAQVADESRIERNRFYRLIREDQPVQIEDAYKIILALRSLSGHPVNLEDIWPAEGERK